MTIKYATIKDDTLEFEYSQGTITVEVKMPYSTLSKWLEKYQSVGTLHDLVEMFINQVFKIEEVL
jgi:hypothetical protein